MQLYTFIFVAAVVELLLNVVVSVLVTFHPDIILRSMSRVLFCYASISENGL